VSIGLPSVVIVGGSGLIGLVMWNRILASPGGQEIQQAFSRCPADRAPPSVSASGPAVAPVRAAPPRAAKRITV
jgi:hypothetical protein